MEVIETKMDIKITDNDIDRTHRIGKPKNNGKRDQLLSNLFDIMTEKRFFLVKNC